MEDEVEELRQLLRELLAWINSQGFEPPEVYNERYEYFTTRIREVLGEA